MDAFVNLYASLIQVVFALYEVVVSLIWLVLPWTPLLAWIAYWLLAANWNKLRPILLQGGFIGVLGIGFLMILIWGSVAPPEGGVHSMLGLQLSNFVGKTVYVSFLLVIMLLCGSVQLSGSVDRWLDFSHEEPEPASAHH